MQKIRIVLKRNWTRLALVAVLLVAAALRLYGSNWDDGHLFHPDERKILMVVTEDISLPLPPDWANLLSPQSTLNPHFFAYGSLPLYLLKLVAHFLAYWRVELSSLYHIYLVGRVLSALFDMGTVFLVYLLGAKLYDRRVGLLASTFVAFTVLHIQLAHFYAADTLLTFFIVLIVYFAADVMRTGSMRKGVMMGVCLGLALATKVSVLPLLLTAIVAWGLWAISVIKLSDSPDLRGLVRTLRDSSLQQTRCGLHRARLYRRPRRSYLNDIVWTVEAARGRGQVASGKGWLRKGLGGVLVTFAVAGLVFLMGEPYAMIDWWTFIAYVVRESYMVQGFLDAPYTRQYLNTPAYIYQIKHSVLWAMGPPLGIVAWCGFLFIVLRALRRPRRKEDWLLLSWVLPYFLITGSFHAKFLRYMLPLIPFLCLMGAQALIVLLDRGKAMRQRGYKALGFSFISLTVLASLLYSLAFMNIYTQPHPWLDASEWIYRHVPKGATIAIEHWDDPLPFRLSVDGRSRTPSEYRCREMELYYRDSVMKLRLIIDHIRDSDYIVLSSNRLYGSIPRLPERYPITTRYYELLFGRELGFLLVKFAATYPSLGGVTVVDDTFSDPHLPVPALLASYKPSSIVINFGRADESFTVYDHPKPLIFKKVQELSEEELYDLFSGVVAEADW
jgi:hypothetical protein